MNNKNVSLRVMLLVFLSLTLSACLNYKDPAAVAVAYVDAVYANELKTFKKLVEEKDFESTQDYKLFTQRKTTGRLLTRVARDGITQIEVINSNISEQKAYIKINVTFQNKQVKNLNINLHQNGGRWYVDPMSWATW